MLNLRIDRAASVSLFHPLRKLIPASKPRIPVLMYHSISKVDGRGSHPYYRTDTDPQVFADQVRFLSENGYKSISLSEAVALIGRADGATEGSVVITFDDGYENFYREAFPVLSRYGYSATVFLPTAFIGAVPRRFKAIDCLTWSQVRELRAAGVVFGSHTVNHPQLRSLRAGDVEAELRCSKSTIEHQLGCPVESFSYPYAFPQADRTFRLQLKRILNDAGYHNGVSTTIGTVSRTSEPFFMQRLPINSWDDKKLFHAKLDGAYNWLQTLQYLYKFRSALVPHLG